MNLYLEVIYIWGEYVLPNKFVVYKFCLHAEIFFLHIALVHFKLHSGLGHHQPTAHAPAELNKLVVNSGEHEGIFRS